MSFSDKLEQFEHDIDSPDFEQHDRYNFEVKLDYEVNPSEERKTVYMLEMYGFIPRSLHINDSTYPQARFYNDINLFTRYKTPKFTLKALMNPKITISPLNRIITYLKHPNGMDSKILIEIRMLGAVVRVNLRNRLEAYLKLLKDFNEFEEDHFITYLSRIKQLKSTLRQLSNDIFESGFSTHIKEAYSYMTQFIFIQIELRLTRFLDRCESLLSSTLIEFVKKFILETREERSAFRPLVKMDMTESGESFEYYEGLLKKYAQRILYLDQIRKKKEDQWKQLLYSIAAGFAMVLSLVLTYFVVTRFQEYSFPFVIAIVIIYMFKDRIKFLIQLLSERTILIYFPDRTHRIYDSFEKTSIGMMQETMRFIEPKAIPSDLRKLRDKERLELENQERLETIFKYKKIMELDSNIIMKIHNRTRNVHDIIRFNIRNLIQYADDPSKMHPVLLEEKSDQLTKVRHYKVYHFNLIFKVSKLKSKTVLSTYYKKVRIILTQRGIKRIEYPEIV